ncbi:LOW QUALITY PROTEIN: T-complex protein 1 subunit zeta-2 [Delphinapterus leucas]|uniref:LOW QUALITY PROTEIN: T-complex protein 1 subunit zeta-2 n=1 Tax=Delphinapterus leucas TaxID=9749 RepID=A0A2Y9MIW0_DELLE|nr:LOW QUALITY PROTEIN: T-complex protein 1 subunit zeta-2 [Delphinapterus leucas]
MTAEVKAINSKAEVAQAQAALALNICAARGLQDVLRTNLGPKGTMKMLVSGAGDMKLTKDGNVLLHEMENGIREVFKATGCVVPGAGAVEVAIAEALVTYKHSIKGARLGVQAFADALLIIPKVLAQNSGYDLQETLVKVQVEHSESKQPVEKKNKQPVGIDLNTGEPMVAADAGVWDNYFVKNQLLHSCTVIATNILLVDEIMQAGMSSLKG